MAYTPGSGIEEEKVGAFAPAAPTVSAPTVGGTGGGAAGNTPLADPSTTAGTGFVNIDRVLSANAGAGADAAKQARNLGEKDSMAFAAKAGDFSKKVAAGGLAYPNASIVRDVLDTSNATAPQGAKIHLAEQYTGPDKYENTGTKEGRKADALTNPATTGAVLAAQNTRALYNAGLSAIDRAIYGASPEIQAARADRTAETANQAKISGVLDKSVGEKKAAIEQKRGDLRRTLESKGRELMAADKYGNRAVLARIGEVLGDPSLMNIQPPPSTIIANTPQQAPLPTPTPTGGDLAPRTQPKAAASALPTPPTTPDLATPPMRSVALPTPPANVALSDPKKRIFGM